MLMRSNQWRATVFTAIVVASPVVAQEGSIDYAKGALIAERACSLCHDVTVDESDPPENKVPSFVTIANEPNQSAERLAETILFPHRDMPQFSFETPTGLRDIIGYIMSMRGQK